MRNAEITRWRDESLGLEFTRGADVTGGFPAHHHDVWQVGLQRSGAAVIRAQGRTLQLEPGDVLLLPPGVTHEVLPLGPGATAFVQLEAPELPIEEACARRIEDAELAEVVARLADASEVLAPDRHDLWDRLQLLLARHTGPAPKAEPSASVQAAVSYLRDNLHRNVRLVELCEHTGLHPRTLARRFNATLDTSPHSFHLSLRVNASLDAIDAGWPLVMVAERMGFADQAHLTRVMKKRMGITPRQWRNRRRDETP